ncbi:Flp pilus assembly protein CpaB [Phytopseudomonas punonensis]|uniref:Pilus assembly protein CpaB n=1 Tax=Phytopseudomonas punonensis TaxID=1220495 RepID=A0A1M7AL59_9GAMM|nr:Flp pilus assembly protein CpaB [Pseudomonas punonensis]SHL43468.1 pilus assembly protein CpaB [Pseudomonas punonensis]
MNSRLTLVLAGVFLVGAVITGYWGITLSRQSAPAAPPVAPAAAPVAAVGTQLQAQVDEKQRINVVVLARAVQPLVAISRDDLAVERMRIAPPGSFASPEQVLGRTLWRETPAGTVLNQTAFEMSGPLARMIRPHERALAVAVDEVIGGGGHLSPGDYVDVLLYLRQGEGNAEQTAQVVIPALRLLSVGYNLGITNDGEAAQSPADADEERRRRRNAPTTAVLAVPEVLLTRLMLATQIGSLRLAVRSVDEKRLASYYAGEEPRADIAEAQRQLFQFEALALRGAVPRNQVEPAPTTPAPVTIPVYRGNDATQQNP